MNNKKKKIISTSILLVSLITILLGSMVISSKFNKDVKIDNIDSGSDEGKIGLAGCIIDVSPSTEEAFEIHDGGKVEIGSYEYNCTTSNCYIEFININNNFKGIAGDGNCGTGVRTTQKKLYCTSSKIIPKVCYNDASSSGNTGGNSSGGNTGNNSANKRVIKVIQNNNNEKWEIHDGNIIKYNETDYTCSTETSCYVKYTETGDNFLGLAGDGDCTTGYRKDTTNGTIYATSNGTLTVKACYKNTTPTTKAPTKTYTLTVVIVGKNTDGSSIAIETNVGSIAGYVNGANVNNAQKVGGQIIRSCETTSSCTMRLAATPSSGYAFIKWSSSEECSDSLGGNPMDYSYASNKIIYACFAKTSSGGNSGGGTYTPILEPTVDNNTTVDKNAFFYAKGSEYQGDTIKCGDKLYITKCTNDNDPICEVSSINNKTVSSTTKIRFSNVTSNEKDTGCYQRLERYIAKKTFYYTNRELSSGKTEISCGEIVILKNSLSSSCSNNVCEAEYNNKTVYIDIDDITSDKPACQNQDETKTCETSKEVTNAKGDVTVSICKNDDTEEKRNNIVKCADGYEVKYKLSNDTCKDNASDNCYKEYVYTCSTISKPGISASGGVVNSNGKGIINVTGTPYGDIPIFGYHVSNGEEPTENSGWSTYNAVNNKFSIERTAGTYFIWAMNNKHKISYPVLAKVYDSDLSTTLATFGVKDSSGNDININMSSLDGTVGYYETIVDSKYALLSNNLIADSVGGFDKLTTSYELSVNSNKIALYATLTSSDASYVTGYEPRTIDLEYGRNVALIKIVNKDGKERCYTFIINRVDDRNNNNLLKNIKLSRGSIDFDPYVTNYDVTISRFTKKVSVNAELDSTTSTFIAGYEPREVEITEDNQSVVLKVISEAGSIRSYVITFNRKGEDKDTSNSTYLSSLTVPGTMLGFDKETYDYTITVPYETENVPIYAFAESETASVTVGNNTGLKVGNNLIQIEVKNNNKTRIYSLHVIRKESGLDISDSAKLGTLSIKNYNLEFSPDKLDYEVKIKREKTLLITATPESNRADIYMYGNNDLTGFSTIRVKVIAENGLTNIYSIDIQKAAYNKKIEIIAASAGIATVVLVGVIIYIKKKYDKKKEYLEG